MFVCIIQYDPDLGFEAWTTDVIASGEGMGSVFETREQVFDFANKSEDMIINLVEEDVSYMYDRELREYLENLLVIDDNGYVHCVTNAA